MNAKYDADRAYNYIKARIPPGAQQVEVALAEYESESDFLYYKPEENFIRYKDALIAFTGQCEKAKWSVKKIPVTEKEFTDYAKRSKRHSGVDNKIIFLLERLGYIKNTSYLKSFGLSPFVVHVATNSPFVKQASTIEHVVFVD